MKNDDNRIALIRPHMGFRMVLLIAGVVFLGLGVALLKTAGFGTDPLSNVSFGLQAHTGVVSGTCQLVENLIMFIPVILFGRRQIGIGTVFNMVFVGYIANFCLWIMEPLLPGTGLGFAARIAVMIVGILIFLVGAALYSAADLGLAPYDADPVIISEHVSRFSFRTVRMAWDISVIIIGALISGSVGITTLILAFGLGPVISAIVNRVKPLLDN